MDCLGFFSLKSQTKYSNLEAVHAFDPSTWDLGSGGRRIKSSISGMDNKRPFLKTKPKTKQEKKMRERKETFIGQDLAYW